MEGITLSQSYLLCVLNKKGKLSPRSAKSAACFTAAGVSELLAAGVLTYEKRRLKAGGELPEGERYLSSLYEYVRAKQPLKAEKLKGRYPFTFRGKHMRELLYAVGDSLVKAGYAKERKAGLLRKRKAYIPDPKAAEGAAMQLRALTQTGEAPVQGALLAVLLDESKVLKKYLPRGERKAVGKRLKQLRRAPQSGGLQAALEFIGSYLRLVPADEN